jgi:hypothetical protein
MDAACPSLTLVSARTYSPLGVTAQKNNGIFTAVTSDLKHLLSATGARDEWANRKVNLVSRNKTIKRE